MIKFQGRDTLVYRPLESKHRRSCCFRSMNSKQFPFLINIWFLMRNKRRNVRGQIVYAAITIKKVKIVGSGVKICLGSSPGFIFLVM